MTAQGKWNCAMLTDCSVFPQMLPQRCTWLYVMNNVLMSVSGNTSVHMLVLSENTECCMLSAALTKCPSCREVLAALFPQSDSSVWTERTRAEETQQSVTQHQPLHWEDQPPVGQDISYREVEKWYKGAVIIILSFLILPLGGTTAKYFIYTKCAFKWLCC